MNGKSWFASQAFEYSLAFHPPPFEMEPIRMSCVTFSVSHFPSDCALIMWILPLAISKVQLIKFCISFWFHSTRQMKHQILISMQPIQCWRCSWSWSLQLLHLVSIVNQIIIRNAKNATNKTDFKSNTLIESVAPLFVRKFGDNIYILIRMFGSAQWSCIDSIIRFWPFFSHVILAHARQ